MSILAVDAGRTHTRAAVFTVAAGAELVRGASMTGPSAATVADPDGPVRVAATIRQVMTDLAAAPGFVLAVAAAGALRPAAATALADELAGLAGVAGEVVVASDLVAAHVARVGAMFELDDLLTGPLRAVLADRGPDTRVRVDPGDVLLGTARLAALPAGAYRPLVVRRPVAGEVVRAAGGVVWRPGAAGVEVVIVHRPRRGDWSLPKGKLDPGETWQQAAVREVGEETGLVVEVGGYLGEVGYPDRRAVPARHKAVRYWVMRAVSGTFTPDPEVDEIRWLPAPEAVATLTYPHDRDLVRTFLATGAR